MQRIYDVHWHDIPFCSFSKLSYFKLPDKIFYKNFYGAFFLKYSDYEDLSIEWREKKESQGRHIVNALQEIPRYSNVLSVGCGMGYLEYKMLPLFRKHKLNLWCYETSDVQFQFLKKYIDPQFLLSGSIQKSIPKNVKFDFIYLLTIDYALTNRQFVELLTILKDFLRSEKSILMVSSLTIEQYKHDNFITSIKNAYNKLVEILTHITKDSEIQFWGWNRTIDELLKLCLQSGLQLKEYGSFENINNLYIKLGL